MRDPNETENERPQPPPKARNGRKKGSRAKGEEVHNLETQLPPAKKSRKTKTLNKKERERVIASLNSIDCSVLKREIDLKLEEQAFSEALMALVCKIHSTEQPLLSIVASHQSCFSGLYKECKQSPDSYLNFQFKWYQYCSAFLLSSQYHLSEINLEDPDAYKISEARSLWLSFCEENGTPVPESNPVMMTISSAIYHFLLDYVSNFQSTSVETVSPIVQEGDDVYYRFGGAAISDMLHLRYKEIKSCRDDRRDLLSQEISILHSINSKDKTNIPQYLSYRDRGYMYFPDAVFLPFLRKVDTLVTEIVNLDGLKQEGDNLIKVSLCG